jgi:hypothetical protein
MENAFDILWITLKIILYFVLWDELICMSFYLLVSLLIYPPVCPSFCLPINLSVHQYVCPSSCLSIHLSVHLLSVHPSVCPSICLSIHQSVHFRVGVTLEMMRTE